MRTKKTRPRLHSTAVGYAGHSYYYATRHAAIGPAARLTNHTHETGFVEESALSSDGGSGEGRAIGQARVPVTAAVAAAAVAARTTGRGGDLAAALDNPTEVERSTALRTNHSVVNLVEMHDIQMIANAAQTPTARRHIVFDAILVNGRERTAGEQLLPTQKVADPSAAAAALSDSGVCGVGEQAGMGKARAEQPFRRRRQRLFMDNAYRAFNGRFGRAASERLGLTSVLVEDNLSGLRLHLDLHLDGVHLHRT